MHRSTLKGRRCDAGLSNLAAGWFFNCLADTTQFVKVKVASSNAMNLTRGVPQGLVVGPISFNCSVLITIYILIYLTAGM